MFYKVTTNPELAHAESLFLGGNKGLGSGEPLVTAFFLTDQSIHNLILHVFLFKDTVFNIYH